MAVHETQSSALRRALRSAIEATDEIRRQLAQVRERIAREERIRGDTDGSTLDYLRRKRTALERELEVRAKLGMGD
jgi:hypothetical protein